MRHTWLSLTCRWGVPHVNPRNLVNNVHTEEMKIGNPISRHSLVFHCLRSIFIAACARTSLMILWGLDTQGSKRRVRVAGLERWSCPDESCAHCVMPAIGQVWLTGRALEITSTHQAHETKPKRGRRAAACICVRVWEAGASLPSMWFNEMVGVVSDVMLL